MLKPLIQFMTSLRVKSRESFLSNMIWLTTTCPGRIIRVQESMILKKWAKSSSIQLVKIKSFNPKSPTAKTRRIRTWILAQAPIRLLFLSKKLLRIIREPIPMGNWLARSLNHFWLKLKEENFGSMKAKPHIRDKHSRRYPAQANMTTRRRKTI